MKAFTRLFTLNKDMISYRYPMAKISVCLFLIALAIARDYYLTITSRWLSAIVSFFCFVLVLACIMCIYNAEAELSYVYRNRKSMNAQGFARKDVTQMDTASIFALLRSNDIIEVEVIVNHELHSVGTSAVNEWSSNVFTDKQYYINQNSYDSYDNFLHAFTQLFPGDKVSVLRIDGMHPKYINKPACFRGKGK